MNVTTDTPLAATATGAGIAASVPVAATVDIDWNEAFCSEGANCFRFGLDDSGRAYIGSTLAPGEYVSDSVEALRALISAVKAGAADHLL
ncbi:hypothetical protein ACFTWD_36120 [Streptomyces sp. NPDC056943]|uniref:hypothetical protein n=1 Tax=Streptomyces sp. NPDC056943 TaxID=3345971 RepID=UPI0036301C62